MYSDADLFFITGADAMAQIMSWKNVEELWELAHFVSVTRPGYQSEDFGRSENISLMEIPAMAISSTDLRARGQAGDPVWYLVPDGVVQYIHKHRLYQDDSGTRQADASALSSSRHTMKQYHRKGSS
jgi:nicotinate-nucleotide adenylyltransferase